MGCYINSNENSGKVYSGSSDTGRGDRGSLYP